MGTKLFHSYIREHLPNSIKKISIRKYNKQILVIDVSNFLYKFLYSSGSKYLVRFMLFYRSLLKQNIYPIFCFDGKPPIEKKKIIEKRKMKRNQKQILIEKMKIEYNKALILLDNIEKAMIKEVSSDNTKIIKKELSIEDTVINLTEQHMYIMNYCNNLYEQIIASTQKCVKITSTILNNLKSLFDILGIKYIQSKDNIEADHLIGILIRQKIANGCISNDLDPLIHGSDLLLYNFNYKSGYALEYSSRDIMNTLKISYRQFVMLAILLGSDYAPRVKYVPSALLVEITCSSNSIKMVSDRLNKKGFSYLLENLELYERAFQMYYKISPIKDVIASDNLFTPFPILNDDTYIKLINLLESCLLESCPSKPCSFEPCSFKFCLLEPCSFESCRSNDCNLKFAMKCYEDIKKLYHNNFTNSFYNLILSRLIKKYPKPYGIKVKKHIKKYIKDNNTEICA